MDDATLHVPADHTVPTPLRRSTDGGVTWEHLLGCTICRQRVKVSEEEYKVALLGELEGTICDPCAERIC